MRGGQRGCMWVDGEAGSWVCGFSFLSTVPAASLWQTYHYAVCCLSPALLATSFIYSGQSVCPAPPILSCCVRAAAQLLHCYYVSSGSCGHRTAFVDLISVFSILPPLLILICWLADIWMHGSLQCVCVLIRGFLWNYSCLTCCNLRRRNEVVFSLCQNADFTPYHLLTGHYFLHFITFVSFSNLTIFVLIYFWTLYCNPLLCLSFHQCYTVLITTVA